MRKDLQLYIVVGVIMSAALSSFGLSLLESWTITTWAGIFKEVVWNVLLGNSNGLPSPLAAASATSGGGLVGALPFLL